MSVKNSGWSASKRVKTPEFIRNRAIVRRRDPCCVRCLTLFNRTVPAEDCDHWVSQANGGTDELTNLWMICRDHCHKSKTAFEKSGVSGFPELIDWSTGWPIEEPDWGEVIRKRHEDWMNNISI